MAQCSVLTVVTSEITNVYFGQGDDYDPIVVGWFHPEKALCIWLQMKTHAYLY